MHRISVIGTSCSGKTTIARHLAEKLKIQHIELDAIHWQPNWTSLPLNQFRLAVESAASGDSWVIDGNYSQVRDIVWARATDVVWLNYPFLRVFWRALTRTTRRVITQEELFAGNRETIRQSLFDRDSILWWVIRTHSRRRREYDMLLHGSSQLTFAVHEVRSSRDEREALEKFSTLS